MQAQAPSRQEPGSAVEAALLCIPQSPSVSRVRRSASGASVLSPSPRSKPPRLQLVLDIDHTLLHAAHVPGGAEAVPIDGVHSFLLDNPRARRQDRYQVRTRHGLHSFLHEVQKFADVHIYTMAAKSYTRKVLNAIDPEVRLIRGRVLCREDNQPDNFSKSLSHLQPADAEPAELDEFKAAYLVVDDRDEVWDNVSRPHVLQVPAFRAFDSDSQQAHIPPRVHDSSAAAWEADGGGGGGSSSASSSSSSGSGSSASGGFAMPDPTLMDVLRVLRRVHLDWSSGGEESADRALDAQRKGVLDKVHLVFAGGLLETPDHPERCAFWRLAESLGAQCHRKWDATFITHVVAGEKRSGSVERAVKEGVHAVSKEWLLHAAQRWCKQREELYPAPGVLPDPSRLPPVPSLPSVEQRIKAALMAVKLIPVVGQNGEQRDFRLRVATRYFVGPALWPRVNALFDRFQALESNPNETSNEERDRVLKELTRLVGDDALGRIVSATEPPTT